jgi:hypothetical protein
LKLLTNYIKPSKREISLKILSEVVELSQVYSQTNRSDRRGGVNRRIFATFIEIMSKTWNMTVPATGQHTKTNKQTKKPQQSVT